MLADLQETPCHIILWLVNIIKMNVETAFEVQFCTCPLVQTRTNSWDGNLLLLCICSANPECDKHDLEEGTLSSCSSKRNGLWSSNLHWIKVYRNTADSSDIKTNGDDTPIGFGANELWKLTRFGKCENRFQFRGTYLPVRLNAIVTELAPKGSPFWWSLHCGNTPYRLQAMFIYEVNYDYETHCISSTKMTVVMELYKNDAHSILLSDDVDIVGDITYKYKNKTKSPVSPQPRRQ